ncbi:MAG: NUDIX hydrolase [Candidatus Accumulibacter sp.]|jgi:ADP-ribose pyrophosphatase YjhB (NUDIX family)|nr:NUDIX hydrolase [Accumulibacter sp.]
MNYWSQCGAKVVLRVPEGDSHPRHVCPRCGEIHYLNPKLVIGCVAEWEERILLCRRAIEPGHGLWTLPAGFMENGESAAQAALRETAEEACARVAIESLFALVSIPHIDQVHLFYRARMLDAEFGAGEESLETRLFDEPRIPWDKLAFRSVAFCLEAYFSDRRCGAFGFHESTLPPH